MADERDGKRTPTHPDGQHEYAFIKLFAFSAATAPDGNVASDAVWFGSANQMYASGMQTYNNTVTVYGDTSRILVQLAPETGSAHPIYDAYVTHFNDAYSTGAAL